MLHHRRRHGHRHCRRPVAGIEQCSGARRVTRNRPLPPTREERARGNSVVRGGGAARYQCVASNARGRPALGPPPGPAGATRVPVCRLRRRWHSRSRPSPGGAGDLASALASGECSMTAAALRACRLNGSVQSAGFRLRLGRRVDSRDAHRLAQPTDSASNGVELAKGSRWSRLTVLPKTSWTETVIRSLLPEGRRRLVE